MKYLPAVAAVCLLIVPSVTLAQQISPNPNPAGNTITVNNKDANNHLDFSNFGSIDITQNGELTNSFTATLTNKTGGTVFNAGGFTNSLTGYFNSDGSVINNGTMTNRGNFFLNSSSSELVNSGVFKNENYGTFLSRGKFVNSGSLTNAFALNFAGTVNNSGSLTNLAVGQVYLGPGVQFLNDGTLDNHGTLEILKDGTLNNFTGTLTNETGATITNKGKIDTSGGTFTNHGTIKGNGHIKGSITDHGHTKPGNSAGVMTIEGDYFKVDGTKEIQLGGLFDGGGDHAITEFDWIDVTGNVELAGLLHVELIDGFEKRINRGQVFEFLRVGGTLSGQYEGLGEGALVGNFGGQDLFITYGGMGDGGGVALFTNAVPEPTTVLIWSMLAGLGITVRRRR